MNQHLGAIGTRSTFEGLTVTAISGWESSFGHVTLINFEDSDGNRLAWQAMNPPSDLLKVGATATVTATVKKHGEQKGQKLTLITRAKATAIRNAA